MTISSVLFPASQSENAAMMFLVFVSLLLGALLQMSRTEEDNVTDNSNSTDYLYDFIDDNLEGTKRTHVLTPTTNHTSRLRVYRGPLPNFPGTTASPWIALHSPVRMYIPIRNTGIISAESADCIQCPRNLLVYLSPRQRQTITPIPTISICSSFAQQSGRVHVAVIAGPRPGQRLSAGRYQVELMVWKAEGTVHSCKYTITVKGKRQLTTARRNTCSKPKQPSNGIILCDPVSRKYYQHNSVCQVFCLPSYLVTNSTSNSSTIICKNGRWSPEEHISCVAASCSSLPQSPAHSSWRCNEEESPTGFRNGTVCKVNCKPGYVTPSSQLGKSTILCRSPSWNNSKSIPECKRALLPKLLNCHNHHLIIRKDQTLKISSQLLPRGTDHDGEKLTPVCSLQKKNLSKGRHQNVCDVTDPELGTKKKCSYQIHIEEISGPHPHAGDCKNRTTFASRKGTIHSKQVRFVVKVGEPARTRIFRSECKPKGELGIGKHFIVCKATDPHTKTTGICSYWLKVQDRTCPPLRDIPNGQVKCRSHAIGAVCNYECNNGYAIRGNHLSRVNKSCHSNLKWQPALDPVCEIKPPDLIDGCENLEFDLAFSSNFTVPLPTFVTSLNETLNVSCTPSFINTVGNHQVWCSVEDERFKTSCKFNATISLEDNLTTPIEVSTEGVKPLEGCDNLELELDSSRSFTVPLPIFMTALNDTLNVSCTPSFINTVGHHQVWCSVENETFSASCNFNVTVSLEDNLTTSAEVLPEEVPQELLDGCDNLELELTSSDNFTVPPPTFITSLGATLNVSCTPSFIDTVGHHRVKCSVEDVKFNVSCNFDVTVFLDEDLTTSNEISTEVGILEGCDDQEINMSSPFNYTVPVPRYLTALNEIPAISCSPSFISVAGQHLVKCSADHALDISCSFNISIKLENELTTILSKDDLYRLVKGCNDLEVNIGFPFNFTIPKPLFLSPGNDSLNVSCIPPFITDIGNHEVKCSVDDSSIFNMSCNFDVTILRKNEETTTSLSEKNLCKPLPSPQHGSLHCTREGDIEACVITCDLGYGFSESNSLGVKCADGLWDFQMNEDTETLPECFAQMEGSAVEVWLSFESFAPHCEEEMEEQMKDLVNDLCQVGTDCSRLTINCTFDDESDMMLMIVNWTVEADFNDEEYYEGEEIPEAEIRLESVLERTRNLLATGEAPGGIHLFRDSFRRGLITLVCPEGYIPNMLMAKCVLCQKETNKC